jgi:hypothetical protein
MAAYKQLTDFLVSPGWSRFLAPASGTIAALRTEAAPSGWSALQSCDCAFAQEIPNA